MKSRHAIVVAVLCVVALLAWLAWPEPERSVSLARDETSDADEPSFASEGDGLGERALRERAAASIVDGGVGARAGGDPTAIVSDAPIERPRPEPMPEVVSRQERSMSAAEKAVQTTRMVELLASRGDRLEERLAEARRQGDAEEVRRQEIILGRLRQRAEHLRARARELEVEAQTEDVSRIPPYEDEHDRDRERHPEDDPDHDQHDHRGHVHVPHPPRAP